MTTIEKIEKIVLPSLRKGLEMEEKATPGPWHWVYGDTDKPCDYALPEKGATKDAEMKVFFSPRLETVWEEGEGWRGLPEFIIPSDGEVTRANAAFIAHTRNVWRRQTEGLILAIEGWLELRVCTCDRPAKVLGDGTVVAPGDHTEDCIMWFRNFQLQSIANLWPDEV